MDIMQMISSVGFPIACCIAMAYYVKDQSDKNREQIEEMNEKHKEEILQVTEAVNNNTVALTKLCERMGVSNAE